MNPDSQSRTNYLVAFLAAIMGLSAFNARLSDYTFTLFGNEYTWLSAVMPLVFTLLLAAYLGALSYFSMSITFTRVPLSKFLNIAMNTTAILALLYPIAVIIMLGVSWTLTQLASSPQTVDKIYLFTTTFTSVLSLAMAVTVARNFYTIRADFQRRSVLESFENAIKKNMPEPKNNSTTYRFLYEYEYLQILMTRYLQFRGYGIDRTSNILKLAKILRSKHVLDDNDIKLAADLHQQRNIYAHGGAAMTEEQLKITTKNIQRLQDKIKTAIIN